MELQNSREEKSHLLSRLFSLDSLPLSLQNNSMIYLTINFLFSIGFHSTDTFLVLYFLENWTFEEVSIIISIRIITQLIFDYPTGVLGDWVGQKIVLVIGFLLKMGSILFLVIPPTFSFFAIYGILSGLGNSQISGALESWYDNKYQETSENIDEGREIYTDFQAKLNIVYVIIAAFTCLISGLIAKIFSRKALFFVEISFYLLILIIILWKIEETRIQDNTKLSPRDYVMKFKSGLKFMFNQKDIFFIFLGVALFEAFLNGVWTGLILMPYSEIYAFNDSNLGILRWISLTLGVVLLGFVKKIPSKSTKPKRGFILSQVGMIVGLLVFLGFLFIFPPGESFELGKFVGRIVIGISLGIPYGLIYLFYSKIMIDLVPNDIRNSVYSLLPTLILAFSIPATILGGSVISDFGLSGGIILVVLGSIGGILIQVLGFRFNWKKTHELGNSETLE